MVVFIHVVVSIFVLNVVDICVVAINGFVETVVCDAVVVEQSVRVVVSGDPGVLILLVTVVLVVFTK